MATQAQIDANRKNALKSTGPKSRPGKDKTRFNGLKHGLRAEQVVLPGEDPAEFAAELKGWSDDWKPQEPYPGRPRRARRRRLVATPPLASASRPTGSASSPRPPPTGSTPSRREAIEAALDLLRDRPRRRPSRGSGPTWTGRPADRLVGRPRRGPRGGPRRLGRRLARPADGPARPPRRRRPRRGRADARWPRRGCSWPTTPGHSTWPPARSRARRPRTRSPSSWGWPTTPGPSCDGPAKSSRTRPSSASGRSARCASTRRRRGCCCTATRWPTTARCGRRSRS